MIKLTSMDGRELVVNAELIERVERVPETVITMTTQKKLLVKESMDEVIEKVVAFRQSILRGPDSWE